MPPQIVILDVDSQSTTAQNAVAGRARTHVDDKASANLLAPKGGEKQSQVMRLIEADTELPMLMIDALKSGLKANQMFYDKHAKDWKAEPDARTRLAAAQLAIQYLEGLPIQRIETKSMTYDATPRKADNISSPAMIEALERKLARAKKATAFQTRAVEPNLGSADTVCASQP